MSVDAKDSRDERPELPLVVVIDDNDDCRLMLHAWVEQAGFRCLSAATGIGGLALVESARPQVAVVDIGLPGLDGLALARRVRANADLAGTRLIALTGYGQAADRAAAREAGFDEHMVKPVDLDRLLTLLVQPRTRDDLSNDRQAEAASRLVLVVDDDPDACAEYAQALRSLGSFTVAVAEDGQHGLSVARSVRPDAIVADFVMPGLDGCELAAHLARDAFIGAVPVVIVSAFVHLIPERGHRAVAAVVAKPCEPDQLVHLVNRVIEQQAAG
ncbi:MAG TPA: response regulator [Polyangiaceae bacterium]